MRHSGFQTPTAPAKQPRRGPATTIARICALLGITAVTIGGPSQCMATASQLMAGVAKVDISSQEAGPVEAPLYVRALALTQGETKVVLLTLDVVAIGEIGHVKNDYLPTIRARLNENWGIDPAHVLANASHCHGIPCDDVESRTVQAVSQALDNMVPVTVGVGVGHEDRVMENRRLKLKSGRTADVRRAYSLPPDEEVAEVGPIDPEIGVLRLDRKDGGPLAVVYNFAGHPIQGVPSGANTADLTGFSSQVIEDNLGHGAVALFVQGCGGDSQPVFYKNVHHPRNALPLGNMLGLSTLDAVREVECRDDTRLKVINETLTLPRADRTQRIFQMEAEQQRLLNSLRGTFLNFETFLSLYVKYGVGGEYPSASSHRYLNDDARGRLDLRKLDSENRRNLRAYVDNIHTMEELTRVQTNLKLLKKHQASLVASGKRTIDVEIAGVRIGDFVLITFPGELTVQIGLNLKRQSPHEHTFVAGYTNGYIYYAPTAEQLLNAGGAQEDSDCILAPEWQAQFEDKALAILQKL